MELSNTAVVITGGSEGLGKELARLFVLENARVHILSNHAETLQTTGAELGVYTHLADVRDEQRLRDIAEEVRDKSGSVAVWINNAAVYRTFPKTELLDMERAREQLDVNFLGSVLGCRTALLHMQENGGTIINILSGTALDATRDKNAKLYAASKWALRGWIDAFREESKELPLHIFSVYPGGMKTNIHKGMLPPAFDDYMSPVSVAEKIIANLKQASPDPDLVIKRPGI